MKKRGIALLLWDPPRKGGSHSSPEARKDARERHKCGHYIRRIGGYNFKEGLRILEGKNMESGILDCNIELEARTIGKEF